MSETLFRLCVIRPPLIPDPRYPPIDLAQESDFQVGLRKAVQGNPTDPRSALENASSAYASSADFAPLSDADPNNVKLDASSIAIDTLVNSTSPPGANHDALVKALKQSLGVGDLSTLPSWFDPLEKRFKDSILALRLLGVEQTIGSLSALTRRLRTIEVARKVCSDPNFPFNAVDLQKCDLRPLVAPTFAELKSILSTATARAAAEAEAQKARKVAQDRIDVLYKDRYRLVAALADIVKLPSVHRLFIPATPFKPVTAPVDMTHLTIASQHLQLVNNLTTLTLKSFGNDVGGTVGQSKPQAAIPAKEGQASQDDVQTAATAPAATLSAIALPLVNMSQTLLTNLNSFTRQPQPTPALAAPAQTPYSLLPSAAKHLSSATTDLLKQINVDIAARPVDSTVSQVNHQLSLNAQALDAQYAPYTFNIAKIQAIGSLNLQYLNPAGSLWGSAFRNGEQSATIIIPPIYLFPKPVGQVNILGVADLLVVKQQLVGYEGGDVAFVENVLKGETKSRELDIMTSTEVQTTTETEITTSHETDVTTAERFEVSNESNNAIKQDESNKAGVTVSASYGPTVSVSANASFSSDQSKSQSTKAASRYSKDITSKATDKITKRVLQRTVTTTLSQTTTKELHSLTNGGPTHISGVYQWLNKIYEAQVWNYGKRTMLDFMIPEPGAFFLDKQTDPNETTNTLVVVPPFTKQPKDLDIDNYSQLGAQYAITDLDPPPQEMSRATAAFAAGKDEPHAKADKITIPAGFQVSGISVTASGVSQLDKMQNWVIVTCGRFQWGWDPSKEVIGYVTVQTDYLLWTDSRTTTIVGQGSLSSVGNAQPLDLQNEQTEIPWSVTAAYMDNFAVTIELFLERTPEAFKLWQDKTWGRIEAAAEKMIQTQNDAIEKAKFNATFNSAFQGRNPEKNLIIMRNEMKKNCISIMTDSHYDDMGAIQKSRTAAVPGNLAISEINLSKSQDQGSFVRFFEQAFEWEEMTWMLYPYFWGRKDHWYRRVDYADEDPEFEKFIQAGFARANVPVRPGFEGALEHYLATGTVWNGGPLPGISSPTFLPLATEIQESLGKTADDAVKYGDPWTVKVPTNLVRLRHDDKPPVWVKDKTTGDWVEQDDKGP